MSLKRLCVALVCALVASNSSNEQERVCSALGKQYVAKMKDVFPQDYANNKLADFHSPAFDVCIHTEVAVVGVQFQIRDLSGGILSDTPILNCDRDGADSIILGAVRKHHGLMMTAPFLSGWMTALEGRPEPSRPRQHLMTGSSASASSTSG